MIRTTVLLGVATVFLHGTPVASQEVIQGIDEVYVSWDRAAPFTGNQLRSVYGDRVTLFDDVSEVPILDQPTTLSLENEPGPQNPAPETPVVPNTGTPTPLTPWCYCTQDFAAKIQRDENELWETLVNSAAQVNFGINSGKHLKTSTVTLPNYDGVGSTQDYMQFMKQVRE